MKRSHDRSQDQITRHLRKFLTAYNVAKRGKARRDPALYQYGSRVLTLEPQHFS
jgi:hypothetical protein